MFGSKINKVEDVIMDYSQFGIPAEETVVGDHRVSVTISKFCKALTSSLKYTMLELIPCKRFALNENDVVTDEAKIITSKVVQQLRMVRIASDCPYDSFQLFYRYKGKPNPNPETGKMYMYINTRDIELFNEDKKSNQQAKKYFNAMDFCAIEYGKYIKITGKIETHNSYGSNSIHKYITTEYKQHYEIGTNDVTEYYDGVFEFHFIDNRDANDVLTEALNIIISIVDDILNRDERIKLVLDSYSVDVAYDRSGVIAHLIDSYILMQTKNRVIKTDKESINGITKMSFTDIPAEELNVILEKALKALRTELVSLIGDLK